MLAKTSAAVFVQPKGFGLALLMSMRRRMACSSWRVERWGAATDAALGQRGEPELDLIEPGGRGRREVHVQAWMPDVSGWPSHLERQR